jgi:hypothetical protein
VLEKATQFELDAAPEGAAKRRSKSPAMGAEILLQNPRIIQGFDSPQRPKFIKVIYISMTY